MIKYGNLAHFLQNQSNITPALQLWAASAMDPRFFVKINESEIFGRRGSRVCPGAD
jgi:hypothetical protein